MIDSETSASPFQFLDPVVERSLFWENPHYDQTTNAMQKIYLKTRVTDQQKKGDQAQAKVALLVTNSPHAFDLKTIDPSLPYLVTVVITSTFYWGADVPEDKFPALLNENASTLLLSYIRPIVTELTSQSNYRPLRIPFINFQDSTPDEPDDTFNL